MTGNEKAVRPQILLNWSVDTYDINYIITYYSILKEKTVNIEFVNSLKRSYYALLCFNLLNICVNISMTSFSLVMISTRPYTPKNRIAEITSVINT